jgi:hypothetical protein
MSINVNEFQWISMNFNEFRWISMNFVCYQALNIYLCVLCTMYVKGIQYILFQCISRRIEVRGIEEATIYFTYYKIKYKQKPTWYFWEYFGGKNLGLNFSFFSILAWKKKEKSGLARSITSQRGLTTLRIKCYTFVWAAAARGSWTRKKYQKNFFE